MTHTPPGSSPPGRPQGLIARTAGQGKSPEAFFRDGAYLSRTWDEVRAEAARGGYRLIDTDKLWQQYRSNPAGLLLIDTRQEWEYRSGHIQGAINFPMEPTWLSRWRKKGALGKVLGPDKNRLIVFY